MSNKQNSKTILDDQIRKRLIEAITTSGLTQEEIATRIFVSQSTISSYKTKGKLPSLPTFARLCQVLDVDANEILNIK